ncbi:hypothetical protein VAMP_201n20 [Candidatus Vampirococcus lugosii]|uniref:Uncharacterized protein n=1 Tax=Candidatus Vampirococcus lugosii TaxID=2789015 RepID=A0ABS5QM33_9BACT|nr:hypothetical protein [Candidatus Vampirococcus lugosii]
MMNLISKNNLNIYLKIKLILQNKNSGEKNLKYVKCKKKLQTKIFKYQIYNYYINLFST